MSSTQELPDGIAMHTAANDVYENLALRPGFLIRRLHQIHVAIFLEECKQFNVTPVQYSILTALRAGELDQTALANKVGMDLATTAQVLSRLEDRGWLIRYKNPVDRRQRIARLSPQGIRLLEDMDKPAKRAHDLTLAHLDTQERERFIDYLLRLVDANNVYSRAPLRLS